MAGKNQKPLSARVPEPVYQYVIEKADEKDISKSAATRELLEEATGVYQEDEEEEDGASAASYGAVIPSATVAVTVAAIALLAVGELAVGVTTLGFAGFLALNWVLGWDAAAFQVLIRIREGLDRVGGASGFFRLMWARWKDEHPIDDPQTPVEKAARADLYVPALVAVFLVVGVAGVGIIEAGLLEVIGPYGALAYLLILLFVAYSVPAAILLSALSMLAIESARSWREDDAIAPGADDE